MARSLEKGVVQNTLRFASSGPETESNSLWCNVRSRLAHLVLIFGLLSVVTLGFIHISLPDMRASDDNIWLYMAAGALTTGASESGDAERELTDRVRAAGAEEAANLRYGMRVGYRNNYLLPMLLWGVTARSLDTGSTSTLEDYGKKVAAAIIAGASMSHAAAALLLALGVLWTRRTDLAAATFGGLTLLLVLTFVIPSGAAFLFWERDGVGAYTNAVLFALNPHAQYTVFGFTPRSQIGLFVLLAFILRWRGWLGAGYAILALSGLVHQSMATLIFGVVLIMDIALHPSELKQRYVWPFIVIGILLIASRETLWSYVLAPAALLRLALVAAMGAIIAFAVRAAWRAGYFTWLSALRARIASSPLYAIDALVLGGGWLMTLPLGGILAQYASPMQRLYFWNQVHTRTWLMIAPVIAAAIIIALWNRLATTDAGHRIARHPLSAACAAVALIVLPLYAVVQPLTVITSETQRLQTQMQTVARKLSTPLQRAPSIDDEPVLYLGAARQQDTGEPMVKRLIPLPPTPPAE